LRQDVCDDLLARGLRSRVDHSSNLAGVLEREYLLAEEDRRYIEALLEDELSKYAHERARYHGERPAIVSFRLDEVWINIMGAGDFNPPHTHYGGDISFVLYLQIPQGLKEEFESNRRNNSGPGSIEFSYGQPDAWVTSSHVILPAAGDLLIFPAQLVHFVSPYKTNGDRISIAGNVVSIRPDAAERED
jgi:uncharacterized protein (TIGR02466 family)